MIGLTMETLDPKAEYIVKNGKATAVILPLKQYTELLEDLQDLAVIARRKNEPTIPLAEVKARLRRNGALRPLIFVVRPRKTCGSSMRLSDDVCYARSTP